MATLAEWQAKNKITSPQTTTESMEWFGGEDAGWARSMAAAIPSGIFKIFEGAATLGAALLDLGVDRDRVDAVEQFFADSSLLYRTPNICIHFLIHLLITSFYGGHSMGT